MVRQKKILVAGTKILTWFVFGLYKPCFFSYSLLGSVESACSAKRPIGLEYPLVSEVSPRCFWPREGPLFELAIKLQP